jgi:hypothetical protein
MYTSDFRFTSFLVILLAACSGRPASQDPASPDPAPTAASEAPEPAAPAAVETGEANGAASPCGEHGVERTEDITCLVVLEKDGVACCYEREEDACREAGCALSECDLLKSLPVQVRCR